MNQEDTSIKELSANSAQEKITDIKRGILSPHIVIDEACPIGIALIYSPLDPDWKILKISKKE